MLSRELLVIVIGSMIIMRIPRDWLFSDSQSKPPDCTQIFHTVNFMLFFIFEFVYYCIEMTETKLSTL